MTSQVEQKLYALYESVIDPNRDDAIHDELYSGEEIDIQELNEPEIKSFFGGKLKNVFDSRDEDRGIGGFEHHGTRGYQSIPTRIATGTQHFKLTLPSGKVVIAKVEATYENGEQIGLSMYYTLTDGTEPNWVELDKDFQDLFEDFISEVNDSSQPQERE